MPLVRNGAPVRIELPEDGEWVDVKPRLSRGEEVTIRQAAAAGATGDGEGNVVVNVASAVEAAEFARLDIALVAWSFPDPVTSENIRALDGDSVDAIKARLDVLYAGRSDDERKNFASNGATTPSTSGLALVSSGGSE